MVTRYTRLRVCSTQYGNSRLDVARKHLVTQYPSYSTRFDLVTMILNCRMLRKMVKWSWIEKSGMRLQRTDRNWGFQFKDGGLVDLANHPNYECLDTRFIYDPHYCSFVRVLLRWQMKECIAFTRPRFSVSRRSMAESVDRREEIRARAWKNRDWGSHLLKGRREVYW